MKVLNLIRKSTPHIKHLSDVRRQTHSIICGPWNIGVDQRVGVFLVAMVVILKDEKVDILTAFSDTK